MDRRDVKDFIETWHYSGSINGVKSSRCFGLLDHGRLIGAMIYGNLAMANNWKRYVENKDDILELRRLCCIDDTLKNTESFFIGKTLRWLKKNTGVKKVVSYADPNHGHDGTIYKASNFQYLGQNPPGRVIVRLSDGKEYHDKSIRTKYKGKLKPFAVKLRQQLGTGEAIYKKIRGKHVYLYNIARVV